MPEGKGTKNIWDLAQEVGLNPVVCSCGEKLDGASALEDFFQMIISSCKDGSEVRIKNFGTFSAKVLKGRKVKSSALHAGEVDFDDALVLRFRQSAVCKKELNKKR